MSLRMRDHVLSATRSLRHEPTEKHVRALFGDRTVVDSVRALLVWEPRRVLPSYAVPVDDIHAEIVPEPPPTDAPGSDPRAAGAILHSRIPFRVHSTPGVPLGVRSGERAAAAFRPSDPDLAGHVVLDFHGFDAWYEEDERIVAHPRDPFHRVDIRQSSRPVRVELDGRVVAESSQPRLLFETHLPVRFYLSPNDVLVELIPSARRTYCAYKGEARYWSIEIGSKIYRDIAWSYAAPLRDGEYIRDRIAFFDEKVDVVLDGERRPRPSGAMSAAILEEAGV